MPCIRLARGKFELANQDSVGGKNSSVLVRVVRKVDSAIHRINHYPADSVVCFVDTYPLDCDLSGG